jgi:hypothetical protein
MNSETATPIQLIELTGNLDRQTAEALHLELCRLAKQYGVTIGQLHVENLTKQPSQ